MAGNPAPQLPQGDGGVEFSQGVQSVDAHYQQGGGYAVQQFQPPPHHQQLEPQPVPPSPHYDSTSQHGAYYPSEQSYSVSIHLLLSTFAASRFLNSNKYTL